MTGSIATMNLGQVRIANPILTTHVQGYRHPEYVGYALFPPVPVDAYAGQVIEFGKESFVKYNLRRAPGGPTARVSFGYAGKNYALVQDSAEAGVPVEHQEEAEAVPGLDLGRGAVNVTMRAIQLSLEVDQAALATNDALYGANFKTTLAGATKWSHADGKPVTDIRAGADQIRKGTGVRPNTLLLSADAWTAMQLNPQMKSYYTNSDGPLTLEMAKRVLEVQKIVVGEGIYAPAVGADTVDIWGNNAILAYVANPSGAETPDMGNPSFGYTYVKRGHPFAAEPRWDGGTKSWLYGTTMARAPVLSGITAAFLFKNPK